MAATRMSALRQTSGRLRVREWQTVTVALAFSSSMATGFPTMSLRPTTTAFCPSMGILLRRRTSITPLGVQGTSPGRCVDKLPTFTGWNPSTSFSGDTASNTFFESTCLGSGSCTRIPSISSRWFRVPTICSSSSVETESGGASFSLWMPSCSQALTLLRT